MALTICVCRERITAADDSGLFVALRAHCDEKHAELGITDDQIRRNLSMMAGMEPWNGEREELPGPIVVQPLTPAREQDFLGYFDRDAFTDNPGWASCYCFYYRFDGGQAAWNKRGRDENRAAQAAAIQRGEASGFLAYSDDKVVGWCHAAPRGDLPLLDTGPSDEGGERVAAIVCFNVKPALRGQGIAQALLNGATAALFGAGFDLIEAYPLPEPKDSGQAYHGPLSMYEAAGFVRVRKEGHYVVVRKRAS